MVRHALDITNDTAHVAPAPRDAPAAAMRDRYETTCLSDLAAVEASREAGLLAAWEDVLARDESASFFQTPAWCLTWYRCYERDFQPLVLTVASGGVLVGLVPLAVERATGRLAFAGDNMSDYRDVISAGEHREAVVLALLRHYRAGRFPNVLRLGPLQPASPTLQLATSRARACHLRTITRAHECWRLWFGGAAELKSLTGKESVRRRLNYYKRQGELTLERFETIDAWSRLRETFCAHHSLRQLQTARAVSFNDPRKRAFYDTLLAEHAAEMHVTAMRVGARYVAEHFGYIFRDVLYWGAPAHDIAEEKNSPGQSMLALLIQSAASEGLRGIDFTLGTEDFKRRFGNERVDLPTVEIYASAARYQLRQTRDAMVFATKRVAEKSGARSAQALARSIERTRELTERGLRSNAGDLARRALRGKAGDAFYFATPATLSEAASQLNAAPRLHANAVCAFRRNELNDLTRWETCAPETLDALTVTARSAPEALRRGDALHTVLIDDQLAGWVWSRASVTRASAGQAAGSATAQSNASDAPEASGMQDTEAQSVVLADCYVLPAWRGRGLCVSLLAHVLQVEFAAGKGRAEIACASSNKAARKALMRAGFRVADAASGVVGGESESRAK